MATTATRPAGAAARRAYERGRLRLARLRADGGRSLQDVCRSTIEAAACTIGVERVGIWFFVEDRRALRCFLLYERSKRAYSEGAMLYRVDVPAYFQALQEHRDVPAEDARHDPSTSELRDLYLVPLGIGAMLDVPIYRGGEVVGVVCHEHVGGVRQWTAEERAFAASVADAVALRFEEAARRDAEERLVAQEAALDELSAMEAVARVAVGGLHDMRNALAAVLVSAETIARHPEQVAEVGASARRIVEAAERGTAIAQQLEAFARGGREVPAVLDLGAEVVRLAPFLRTALGARHTLEITRSTPVGHVLIDPTQLERVLLNLVVNARDAMPDGGDVRIEVDEVRVEDGHEAPGVYLVLAVHDDGVGMTSTVRARAFEPFFTTKAEGKGSGLGLAIVHSAVERAGGFVHADTAPGEGTTVRVYLPRIAAVPGGAGAP